MVAIKKIVLIVLAMAMSFSNAFAQDSTSIYKKRVLESAEVDFLTSYYSQNGNNASITGGVGIEKLTDVTPTIIVSVPLNTDDVLTIDAGVSAYTSASSSNLDPFDASGASQVDNQNNSGSFKNVFGSPWVESSGASRQDVWTNINASYSHTSDNRNNIWSTNISLATEYDYFSIGFGGGYSKLFNKKNTELSINAKVYLDTWKPRYPTELDSYLNANKNLNQGFFEDVNILNEDAFVINKSGNSGEIWNPENFGFIENKTRNSYSLSLGLSQILGKNTQFSVFLDAIIQSGWLANPSQRVYFTDVDNFYIGNGASISNYTNFNNTDVFQLADDIERLPNSRFKIPVGLRLNHYLNEFISVRTYYRYYFDDWGVNAHTASIELPVKLFSKFTFYPSYRYYTQTAADYFAPFEVHLSTNEFYTSDYDLSKFSANQYGFGITYTDIFAKAHLWKLGLKSIDFKYNYYKRNTGLDADYVALGFKFIMN